MSLELGRSRIADTARGSSFSVVAVVVLYRTEPQNSTTLASLALCQSLEFCRQLVVVDHSPADQRSAFERLAAQLPVHSTYTYDPGNPPLGLAYNRAIRLHLGEASYVLTLDQDTLVPADYFVLAARDALRANFPSVMAPNIRAGTRLASPCTLFLGWGRRWPAPRTGWQSLKRCSLINSGAWIHRRVFETYELWYSERLSLYGIDTDFFLRIGVKDTRFWVLPVTISHDISFDSADLEGKVRKLGAILDANRMIYAGAPAWKRFAVSALSTLVRIKYALRHRSLRFL